MLSRNSCNPSAPLLEMRTIQLEFSTRKTSVDNVLLCLPPGVLAHDVSSSNTTHVSLTAFEEPFPGQPLAPIELERSIDDSKTHVRAIAIDDLSYGQQVQSVLGERCIGS